MAPNLWLHMRQCNHIKNAKIYCDTYKSLLLLCWVIINLVKTQFCYLGFSREKRSLNFTLKLFIIYFIIESVLMYIPLKILLNELCNKSTFPQHKTYPLKHRKK